MILQLSPAVEFIIWLIIATILLGLFIFFATWIIVSQEKARGRIVMIFLCALIIILILPIIGSAISAVFGILGNWITNLTGGGNYLMNLVPIVQFLVFLLLLKFFLGEDWGDAVWISLISLFLLYVMYTILPVLYTFINSFIPI